MNLAALRAGKELSQQSLAEQVGVTRQMISALENGAKPSVEVAKKIAEVLDFDWVRFYEDESAIAASKRDSA